MDVGVSMPSGTMQDTSYSMTYPTTGFQKDSWVDKDLSSLLENTGLQGLFNGEDLASFFAMETMIP